MTSPLAQPDGRVAVITGAASGFGRELATQCAALGMRLVLADLDLAGLDAARALAGLDDVMGVAHGIRAFAPEMIARECLFHELRAAGHPVGVSVLCPAYVLTGIADSQRHRPADLAEVNPDNDDFMARTRTAMMSGRLTATDVARLTLEAVRQERFYVFAHPRAIGGVEHRLRDMLQGHVPANPLGSAP